MPELPEVETTRRGIEPAVVGQVIRSIVVREPRLRWRVPRELPQQAAGQRLRDLRRRAKYLLFDLERGTHDSAPGHVGQPAADAELDRRRRCTITSTSCSTRGCACASTIRGDSAACCGRDDDPLQHPLLQSLAPEPLSAQFNGEYLARAAAGRSVAIKQLIMNGQIVVGVGNIYASEALFRAGIQPASLRGTHQARGVRCAREIDQGRAARGDPRRRHDAARLRQSGRNAGILSAKAVRVRTHARAVPSVSRADQAVRAGADGRRIFVRSVSVEFSRRRRRRRRADRTRL